MAVSVLQQQAAHVAARGYSRSAEGTVSVTDGAGGTTLTATSPLSARAGIYVFVPDTVTATLYLSTETPTSSNYFATVTGGDERWFQFGSDITLNALSSSGSVSVVVLELGGARVMQGVPAIVGRSEWEYRTPDLPLHLFGEVSTSSTPAASGSQASYQYRYLVMTNGASSEDYVGTWVMDPDYAGGDVRLYYTGILLSAPSAGTETIQINTALTGQATATLTSTSLPTVADGTANQVGTTTISHRVSWSDTLTPSSLTGGETALLRLQRDDADTFAAVFRLERVAIRYKALRRRTL